ncbi:MAG: hypothetical protein QXU88_00785 [Candidatus Woesearchaeota archaeon]
MSQEWEAAIKKALEKNPKLAEKIKLQQYKARLKRGYFEKLTRKYLPIPLFVGFGAAYILYSKYGSTEVVKTFLESILGLTIVASLIALISRNKD